MPYNDAGIGWKRGDTSHAAAEDMKPSVRLIRARILDLLRHAGPQAADEAAEKLGLHPLSVRPRFSELSNDGRIVPTDERRPSIFNKPQIVWRLT